MESKSILQTHHQRTNLGHLKSHTSFDTQSPQKSKHPLILHLHNSIQKYKRYKKDYTWRRLNQKITTIIFHFFEKTQKLKCKSWKLKFVFTLSQMSKLFFFFSLGAYNNLFKSSKGLLKKFKAGAYSVRKHFKLICKLNRNSVMGFQKTIGWIFKITDWIGLTAKSTKWNNFKPLSKTTKYQTTDWNDKTTDCFSTSL